MEKRLCPRCNRSVEPIKIFDRSPETGKPYLITRCSSERCRWNFDIEDYRAPAQDIPNPSDAGRSIWDDFIR